MFLNKVNTSHVLYTPQRRWFTFLIYLKQKKRQKKFTNYLIKF